MSELDHLSRANLPYIESLYADYRRDPGSVPESWRYFFEGVAFSQNLGSEGLHPKELSVWRLIQSYRDYGHFQADINPVTRHSLEEHLLQLTRFGLDESDMDTAFESGSLVGMEGATLREILEFLQRTYCGTLAVQVASSAPEIREWFLNEMEQPTFQLNAEERREIYRSVARTEALEKFLHTRFVGAKRFSVEGADSLLPMLENVVTRGTPLGLEEIVIGMAHRGRINVLANFMDKAHEFIFAEFDGARFEGEDFDGDVKYHLGFSSDKETPHGPCHISLSFNPSHLEAVTPVALGMVRAKQRQRRDHDERRKVIPVIIHGDAAFAGQGVVTESLQLSQLKGYMVGGAIHIIVDNQIGFTADSVDTRSSPYASDLSKGLLTPVIHCNGDDPEACVRAIDMAVRFRQAYNRDVVVNMICYRRHGHNEGDEPAFTQPKMYESIRAHPTLRELYAQRLHDENVTDETFTEGFYQEKMDNLQKILDKARENPPKLKPIAFQGFWKGYRQGLREDNFNAVDTTFPLEKLQEIGRHLARVPEGFKVHNKIKRLLDGRVRMAEGEDPCDWGMAELLAYASLVSEGTPCRLSGQDSVRGTFSHRHSCIYDMESGELYNPIDALKTEEYGFCVYDSPLSEMAVLGFEYGNSSSDPTFFTVWEAQFGDFSNGAQIIIDQFLSSAESKWNRMSGLTLLLPHGYEGQGPEHSSARLERYLQLCAMGNLIICNLTNPAQIFHAFRRQMKRDFKKPLIIMSPKSLLRHPDVTCSLEDLATGTFREILPDPVDPSEVRRVILCSGKLYYDIEKHRKDHENAEKIAMIRVEQLYPFPWPHIVNELKRYPKLAELVWAQEEPRNMGAASWVSTRLAGLLVDAGLDIPLRYIGRDERASPATGSPYVHAEEQAHIVDECLQLESSTGGAA